MTEGDHMVLSYPDQEECPAHPPFCGCENQELAHFQRKGSHLRIVAKVVCHFFFCTTCGTHITMLPSSCVPYKHFAADDVEYCLGEAVSGRSPAEIEGDSANVPGVHRSTIKRWWEEWIIGSAQLASVSSEKFSEFLSGGPKAIYQNLSDRYRGRKFFRSIQPDLCRAHPPMGVFRPLTVLS